MKLVLIRLLADYGMLFVLLVLCVFVSIMTNAEQHPTDTTAARRLASEITAGFGTKARVLIVTRDVEGDVTFGNALRDELADHQVPVVGYVKGEPRDARGVLKKLSDENQQVDVVAGTQTTGTWILFRNLPEDFPKLGKVSVVVPKSYRWPNFLKRENLLNVANQIAINAIIAIGMTMVIITGGIDLSVGSIVALSAVVSCLVMKKLGGESAPVLGIVAGGAVGIMMAASIGLFSGSMITLFRVPPFIVTLAMMLIARGLAFKITSGESVNQIPVSFGRFANGNLIGTIPNAVLLMLSLFCIAHIVMSRTVLGRRLYAVGGNIEAARLSGVSVRSILVFTYAMSGLLAGLGGVLQASQLKSGSPTFGVMTELYVIAAVVVGGTSLSGGEGNMFGTLIGAFIVAVVQNGMNLMNVEPYSQQIVLGAVLLIAVLLDKLKQNVWKQRGVT